MASNNNSSIMNDIKAYKKPLVAGAVGVGLGVLSKNLLKKELLPVKNFNEALLSFATITVTDILTNYLFDNGYIKIF